MHLEPTGTRARDEAELAELFSAGFPEFITADQSVKPVIERVREYFAHLDVVMVADHRRAVAAGWGVPFSWAGGPDALPETYGGLLCLAVEGHESGVPADTLALCGAVVHPGHKGAANRLGAVVAPLRPTLKHRYPLTPIEQYVTWVRADGLPLDPWLRLHHRLGGRVVGLALPGSGDYVIPHGLSPLHVDASTGTGTYVEPNIWVRQR